MTEHFDTLETRDPRAARARACSARCRARSRYAKAHAPAFARILAGRRCRRGHLARGAGADCPSRASRSLRRTAEGERGRSAGSPRGGVGQAARVFASPGPIYEPEGRGADYWRLARALFAAGFRAGRSRAQLLFAITSRRPARCSKRARMRSAARCFPAAPGRPSSRCRRSPSSRRTATSARRRSCGSSSRRPTSWASRCHRCARRSCRAKRFPPALRDALAARGIAGYQVYASADLGAIAYETRSARRAWSSTKACWSRSCGPGTGDPVAAGEVGEVVVTTLSNATIR